MGEAGTQVEGTGKPDSLKYNLLVVLDVRSVKIFHMIIKRSQGKN